MGGLHLFCILLMLPVLIQPCYGDDWRDVAWPEDKCVAYAREKFGIWIYKSGPENTDYLCGEDGSDNVYGLSLAPWGCDLMSSSCPKPTRKPNSSGVTKPGFVLAIIALWFKTG